MNGLSVLLTLVLFLLANQVAIELRRAGASPTEGSARNSNVTHLILAKHSSPRQNPFFSQ